MVEAVQSSCEHRRYAPDVANEIFVVLTELLDQMVANGQQPVVLFRRKRALHSAS